MAIFMTWEWKIGDPVDDANGGSMDAQNWTGDNYIDEKSSESSFDNYKNEEYSKKAWEYYNDFKDEEALQYINLALDLYDRSSGDWNLKALILDSLKRFEESEKCFDRSLQIYQDDEVSDNKARMLYRWAMNLLDESKKLSNGLDILYEARQKIIKSINTFSSKRDEADFSRCLYLRDSIDYYIGYEKEFHKNLETLKCYDKSELFTVTGTNFYDASKKLNSGVPLRLLKEPDNEFDGDAIAVYVEDEKVGYVANNDYTKYDLTSQASELHDKIADICHGEFLFFLSRYSAVQFSIGRIIN